MLPKARTKGVLVQEIGDELVVYDTERKEAHRLSPSAALVWRHADGERTVEQLASLVDNELHVVGDDLVAVALDELRRANLIDQGAAVGMSRRRAMAKLAAAGVAALTIPSVTSIAAPTAAAQGSAPPSGCDPVDLQQNDPLGDFDGDGIPNGDDTDPCGSSTGGTT